jgi:hypothetical protein
MSRIRDISTRGWESQDLQNGGIPPICLDGRDGTRRELGDQPGQTRRDPVVGGRVHPDCARILPARR